MLFTALLLAAGPSSPAGTAHVEDWPQWGGPRRTGVSSETRWSAERKDAPLWRAHVGLGYSSVAVVGERLYTLGFDVDLARDVVFCLDALTGEERWTYDYPAKRMDRDHGGGTLTTPTVDGELVFVSEREGTLRCLKAASGDVVWERQVVKEFELELPRWGFAASPVVLGDQLILNYGEVIAFDKKSGKPSWRTRKSYGSAYSTPVDLTLNGEPALAVLAGKGLVLLSATDGSELAFLPWETADEANSMTPVVLGNRLFISAGWGKGCALIELAEKPAIVWERRSMQNELAGALPWKDHLFGFDAKVLTCIDLQGNEKWRERGLGLGALSIADGRLLVMSEDGEFVIADADGAGFHEFSRTRVFEGGPCWTVPVLANGVIYVRNQAGELAALDHRQL